MMIPNTPAGLEGGTAGPNMYPGGAQTVGYAAAAKVINPPLNYYATAHGATRYAGFWLRVVAYIIDYILISIVGVILAVIGGLAIGIGMGVSGHGNQAVTAGSIVGRGIALIVAWLYFSLMESSSLQATVGKMALGLKVTDLNGARVSFGRATGRFFGKLLSCLLFCIGFMMAGWTRRKQALHDLLAGTLVIRP